MEEFVQIPEDRVGALIGEAGSTKRGLEEKTGANITIHDNQVLIFSENPENLFIAKNIVTAVARGFNPEKALLLLKEDYTLDIIHLMEIAKTEKNLIRIRSRIIGTSGKVREDLERKTNCKISVYGKTVGIIGKFEDVLRCREAVGMLIGGAKHNTVWIFLDGKFDKRKSKKCLLNEEESLDPDEGSVY